MWAPTSKYILAAFSCRVADISTAYISQLELLADVDTTGKRKTFGFGDI